MYNNNVSQCGRVAVYNVSRYGGGGGGGGTIYIVGEGVG